VLLSLGVGAAEARTGGTEFAAHVFPVAGPHGVRGAIGEFGAPRSGGRLHEGFDIVAPCGARLLAAASGRVVRVGHDPVLYGNHLRIRGAGERRTYFYSHLIRPPAVSRGDRVWAGRPVGAVGRTGNARTVGCHLHFEIWVGKGWYSGGRPIDPYSTLKYWDSYS